MNKKKAWIVDTLITTTMDRISMKDGEMMKNEMMDKNDEMMKENMMHKDDMMKHTVSLENVVGSTTIR